MMDALKRITKARVRMLKEHPFFGTLALNLEPKEIHDGPGPLATDGQYLYYDPDKVPNLSDDDLTFIVAHEAMHCALHHTGASRLNGRDKRRWGFATDFAVNDILVSSGMFLPHGGLYKAELHGKSAEEIYAMLPVPPPTPGGGGAGGAQGENQDEQQGTGDGEGDGEGKDQDGNDGKPRKPGKGPCDNSRWGKGDQNDREMEQKWKMAVASAADAARRQGRLPGDVQRLVNAILHPRLPWKQILQEFMVPSPFDYTFNPPDRRYDGSQFIMPDLGGEKVEGIVVAIDTSGSIQEKELTEFVSEVLGILHACDGVKGTVVFCDAEVQSTLDVTPDTTVKEITGKVKGYGGTDFRPVFEWVKEKASDATCLIYLTDGYGDFPDHAPAYPVLWVMNTDQKAPWGRVARIKGDVQ